MGAGIYLNNGVYAYAMDLEKKLHRRKNAIIIEEYKGDLTGIELEKELQRIADRYNDNKKPLEKIEKIKGSLDNETCLRYHWINNKTGETITSIYPHLNNIPFLKLDDWEQVIK